MKLEHFTDENGIEWVRRMVEPGDRMRWSGVPSRFWSFAGEPRKTRAVDFAQSLLDGAGVMLVLAGGTGSGKSTAAAFALSKRSGLWVHGPDLAKVEVRDPFDPFRPTLDERMRLAGLLVLDDIGIEHSPGGYAASRITDVLEWREASKRPSIVTTNLGAEVFARQYGKRLCSRINGDPLGWQTVTDKDMRVAHWSESAEAKR